MSEATPGGRLEDEQLVDWLRLIRSENIGPRTFRQLINRYGGARQALEALPELVAKTLRGRVIRLVDRDDRHPLDHRAVGGQWGGDRVADHHLLVTHPLRRLRIEDANVLRRLAKNSLLGPGGRGGGGLRWPTATHAGPRQPGAHYAAKHAVGHQVTSLQRESGQPGGFATRLGGRMSQSLTFRTVGHQLRQAPVAHLSWVNSSRPEVDGFDRGCCWPRGLEGTDENPACR